MMKFVILDTETTGAEEKDRICQIAYIVASPQLVGTTIEEVHEDLCKPPVEIGFGAMAVHHITNETVAKKPPCVQTESFRRLEELNTAENILVIQNAPFDLAMLQKEGFRSRMPLIDTLRCLRHLYPDLEAHALQYIRYAFGLYKTEKREARSIGLKISPHDALGDVFILKLLLDYLLIDHAPEELVELTKKPITYKTFKFGKYKGEEIIEVAKKDPGYIEWLLMEKESEEGLDEDWRQTLQKALEIAEEEAVWLFPFGKYKGQSIEEIASHDVGYLKWALENMDKLSEGMKKAIRKRIEA
ncbi:exonuclease domain-containing protein [Hydrogenimonas urashimensis]|uniref:exodeoxyribonuclease X C-terminal domain-containing protein n=1 Tax=Hydrogenimonas urashimensis TaxID=2740515 RepID=UPI0019150465|nr:exonuclease domain-containing protein [Hydrogenimonas urashimensis]